MSKIEDGLTFYITAEWSCAAPDVNIPINKIISFLNKPTLYSLISYFECPGTGMQRRTPCCVSQLPYECEYVLQVDGKERVHTHAGQKHTPGVVSPRLSPLLSLLNMPRRLTCLTQPLINVCVCACVQMFSQCCPVFGWNKETLPSIQKYSDWSVRLCYTI